MDARQFLRGRNPLQWGAASANHCQCKGTEMALSLTCACGARFELEDTLAGQEVTCPECQQVLKAPALPALPPRTSVHALASAVLALLGAFTIVGTIAAALVGCLALLRIARHRDQVTGAGFAIFGIVFGLLFTTFTVYALTTSDLFGLEGWVRSSATADELDYSGPLEIIRPGFSLTRPSEKWGVAHSSPADDPSIAAIQMNRDLLLANPHRNAFIDVRALPLGRVRSLEQCESEVLAELDVHPSNAFLDEDDEPNFPAGRSGKVQRLRTRALAEEDDVHGREIVAEVHYGPRRWHFILRLYQRGRGTVYVVRAYVPQQKLRRVEPELTAALDSFTILGR
jgi:hypothetical protein